MIRKRGTRLGRIPRRWQVILLSGGSFCRAVARKSAMVVKHEKFEKKLDISHYFGTFSLLWKH
jgi:hypothetical protein